jgi:hypothetical protein
MIPDWQMNVLNKLQGIKKGELMLTVGRRSGKSMLGSQAFQRIWDDLHARPVERLVLSEGTVYGSRYYCVEPYGGSWLEMEKWVLKTCGESTGSICAEEKYKHAAQPGERWYGNNRKFWFRDQADQLMFVMKWR